MRTPVRNDLGQSLLVSACPPGGMSNLMGTCATPPLPSEQDNVENTCFPQRTRRQTFGTAEPQGHVWSKRVSEPGSSWGLVAPWGWGSLLHFYIRDTSSGSARSL